MKKLIIVRHGVYSFAEGQHLNALGRSQMEFLGSKIKSQYVNGSKPVILTSTATRAVESSEILGRILGAETTPHEILWSEDKRPTQIQQVLDLINLNKEADVVIMVTHFEYTREFPDAFARKVLGATDFPYEEINKGEAWIIDCEEKTIRKIVPHA